MEDGTEHGGEHRTEDGAEHGGEHGVEHGMEHGAGLQAQGDLASAHGPPCLPASLPGSSLLLGASAWAPMTQALPPVPRAPDAGRQRAVGCCGSSWLADPRADQRGPRSQRGLERPPSRCHWARPVPSLPVLLPGLGPGREDPLRGGASARNTGCPGPTLPHRLTPGDRRTEPPAQPTLQASHFTRPHLV